MRIIMKIGEDTYVVRGTKFYLPNYPKDIISAYIINNNYYWDKPALDIIDNYLPNGANIIDIGANIGSHTLYWAKERKANCVYSFEPFEESFNILNKNVELNNLGNVVKTFNYGLSNEPCTAEVTVFVPHNVGGTTFKKSAKGSHTFLPLDTIGISEKIDLIKIDVEGHEIEVLEGGINLIKKNKPLIVIETFTNKAKVDDILLPLGYQQVETIRANEDYIYKHNCK